MPVYNVYWKAIQPNGSSNEGGKTVTASTPLLEKNGVRKKRGQALHLTRLSYCLTILSV